MPRIDSPNPHPVSPPAAALGRRGFLTLATAAAAVSLPTAAQAAAAQDLSVGYLAPAQAAPGLRSAHSLVAGESDFPGRRVRLSVLGLGGERSPHLQGVTLLTHITLPGHARPLEVVHWGMRVRPVECMACGSAQVVALGVDGTLNLSLEVRHAVGPKQTFPLELSGGWRPGAAKLRVGTYLLAFDFAGATPNWSDVTLLPPSDGEVFAVAGSGFSYLIVKMDHAG